MIGRGDGWVVGGIFDCEGEEGSYFGHDNYCKFNV
jgi:hypothetical protein